MYDESSFRQDGAARYGGSQVACADQRNVVRLPQTQDVAHRLNQVVSLVTDATRAGETNPVQVPAYLNRIDPRKIPELLARDRIPALLHELLSSPEIFSEPVSQSRL